MKNSETLTAARAAEKSGDLLKAYDILMEGLAEDPDNRGLRHRAVLMLARAGATSRAQQQYIALGLDDIDDEEDIIALGGRLLKDLSLAAPYEAARTTLARHSKDKYAEAYALDDGAYPGINTATMALLSGNASLSVSIAEDILSTIAPDDETTAESAYYAFATKAEAYLLVRDFERSDRSLRKALKQDPVNYTAHASTLRQFDLICAALNAPTAWLDGHRPPCALHFCGHMFADDAHAGDAAAVVAAIQNAVATLNPSAGFGALAAGSDIAMAEALLAQGVELHIVLPLLEEEFLNQSVRPFGSSWEERYRACLSQATSVRYATMETGIEDESVFAFSSEFAMGLALAHAARLRTQAWQLIAWDGVESQGKAGTGADVARGRSAGLEQTLISFPNSLRTKASSGSASAHPVKAIPRILKAMLFADVRGFSRIQEQHIIPFVESILTPLAEATEALPVKANHVNTWGDGLHYVYPEVEDAADAALTLLKAFDDIDLAAAGLPDHLALRVGGHYGPVSPVPDPFLHEDGFFGTHITIAARIEPVAVPGTFYVSEPYAALLALRASDQYKSDYVGQTELSKKFGRMPLFSVRRV